jgi:hypothetical protein
MVLNEGTSVIQRLFWFASGENPRMNVRILLGDGAR